MSDIRVTYSGLIALFVGLISVVTGIMFTLIVTRSLTPKEFGVWSLIGSLIVYFLVFEPIISYWSTRQIARGEKIGKTAVFSSTIISVSLIPLYVILALFVAGKTDSNLNTMLLGAVLLPLFFISQTLAGINLGHKPHSTSYSLLGFELFKIPIGLALVYFLHLGVNGAILTIAFAYFLKIGIQIYFAKSTFIENFSFKVLKRWFKLSWVTMTTSLAGIIWSLDVFVYAFIVGSTIGIAFYTVSQTIASLIGNSGLISQALYPKLLEDGSSKHITENFGQLLYFAIPLLGISIIFSRYALFALNPKYEEAYMIAIILSFRTLFYVLTNVAYQVLMGLEKIDNTKNTSSNDLLKSKIFLVPKIQLIHHSIYLVSIIPLFLFLNSHHYQELEIVNYWSIITLILQIPLFIYSWIQVRKHTSFTLPYIRIIKFIGGTVLFIVVFYATAGQIIHFKITIFDYLPSLIIELAICITIYLSFTYLVDTKTRSLFKSIMHEIYKKNV